MSTSQAARAPSEPHRPVLLVIDADPAARAATESALARRFQPDYDVLTAANGQLGLAALERLGRHGADVALVAADLHLPDVDGVSLLEGAHVLHRGASRVLLVAMDQYHTRVPFSELAAIQRATALGRIDFYVVKDWVTPEEWLYPQVQEALSAWTRANRPGHVVYRIVGERWSPRSHDLREMLTRNGVPFEFHPADSETGQQLQRAHGVDSRRLPAAIHHDGTVLHDPSFTEIARTHGIAVEPAPGVYDLVILGGGPAGLAAAVYGASEGLRTLLLEPHSIGGQAGTSSMIRNYLGYPRGIGGGELAHRAWEQAVLLGAQFVFTKAPTALSSLGDLRAMTLGDGTEVLTRAVILATGVVYRRLGIPALDRLVGAGVFYGAARGEAPAMRGERVYVVGGANSAGQAALHLARYAERVTMLVRGHSLAAGMSDYLIQQISATANIEVRLGTRVVDGEGDGRLTGLVLASEERATREHVAAGALFIFIGAEPGTEWLADVLCLDERGFILTGRDLPEQAWALSRSPLPFETSLPGVFAVGDVRFGSVKRVAGAVGEGSVGVGSVHQYLGQLRPAASSR